MTCQVQKRYFYDCYFVFVYVILIKKERLSLKKMSIGENIKEARKEKGLTQNQLGNLCNPKISESTIRKYELGLLNPKIETLQKIAVALGVSINDLKPTLPLKAGELIKKELIDELKKLNISVEGISARDRTDAVIKALEKKKSLLAAYDSMNISGQDKAIEQVELLTKIPEYRKEDKPE